MFNNLITAGKLFAVIITAFSFCASDLCCMEKEQQQSQHPKAPHITVDLPNESPIVFPLTTDGNLDRRYSSVRQLLAAGQQDEQ